MDSSAIRTDVVIIGAGISGLATLKCLKEAGLSAVVLERTGEVGGLWMFRENDYGVMRFTHINVSKYNYCFSDFPFPDDTPDYPHNTDMAKYIVDYVQNFNLEDDIRFRRKVLDIEKIDDEWQVTAKFVDEDGKRILEGESPEIYRSRFIAIATGHHAKPSMAKFPGQDSFTEEIIHSVSYNDAISNGMTGKRVLIVGIGNSAVDAAVDCATVGRSKSVYISTRSGAWVVPNYIFGHPTDIYACRLFFKLPFTLANFIFENVISLVSGHPTRWKLNPKMRALQSQPTVSPTLVHHIQRHNIKIVPNIQRIEGSRVYFVGGKSEEFDKIIMCTGYRIDLPFLSENMQKLVLNKETNEIKLFKNVFSPDIGRTLAFIGFVQPASGGVLTMSETQARWFAQMCKGRVGLPNRSEMVRDMEEEKSQYEGKYTKSARHTIQKDPIVYNDEVAGFIGAKPSLLKHPDLAWRLILGSCGAYQWRLQGPNKWEGAKEAVKKVPLTELMHYSGIFALVLVTVIIYYLYSFFTGLF
ncbi:flavin-containing monooxygenase 5-like [Ruditapes philippinarum]|uniref:flavin-containing monooxygenase 5-like n=1 Tax=Ruditapes philippinarum TaxID=129788 RepID=UPI00295BBDFE|nr:flavin-containing monooxygenase 5-like [Ruditapes philippinarum]